MNPVEGGTVFPVEMPSHRLVGQKHEFLDQLVGFVGGLLFDPVGPAAFVEPHAQLGKVQIEGAGGEASFSEGRSERPRLLEETIEIIGGRPVQAELRLLVSEAVSGVDDRALKAGDADAAVRPDTDKGRVSEPLFLGTQGAEVIRKPLRQHGDDPVHQVNAVGAAAGLLIQGGAGANVVRDIGDVNADLGVAAGKFPE